MTASRPVLDALGDQSARASLMLADRRHRRSNGREVCQHCDESWPCDARRLADALSAAIEEAGAWREHAEIDCAALGRVWRAVNTWLTPASLVGDVLAGARTVVLAAIDGAP